VTPDTLADAEKALVRLDGLARRFASFGVADLLAQTDDGVVVEGVSPATAVDDGALAAFRASMDNDLDTPGAVATIFELVTAAHSAADSGDEAEGGRLAHTAAVLSAALGLTLRAADTEVDEESARLVAERDEARRVRDFGRADALRNELVARGWTVEDTPNGTAIRR
jgi:cysteinyl-tRNA synthetase